MLPPLPSPEKIKQFAEHKPNTAEVMKLIVAYFQAFTKAFVQTICANVDDFLQNLLAHTMALHHKSS
jgi:hypothetical protein